MDNIELVCEHCDTVFKVMKYTHNKDSENNIWYASIKCPNCKKQNIVKEDSLYENTRVSLH